jgi:hypothetical protein
MSRRSPGSPSTASGSRMSAVTTAVVPSLASSSPACAATIGSWSTYTTRASGATRCTAWWVLFWVGRPEPMSMNCRMP